VRGWAAAAGAADEEAETVRDTGAEDTVDELITRDAGALSPADTFGIIRLADALELDEEGSNVTVLEAGFAAAFGAGFLSFAMICLLLPRRGGKRN
jgi:hypothetical protein